MKSKSKNKAHDKRKKQTVICICEYGNAKKVIHSAESQYHKVNKICAEAIFPVGFQDKYSANPVGEHVRRTKKHNGKKSGPKVAEAQKRIIVIVDEYEWQAYANHQHDECQGAKSIVC